MREDKSFTSRKGQFLYAITADRETGTIDILVFDHETDAPAWMYMSPDVALQFAETIVHRIQSLRES